MTDWFLPAGAPGTPDEWCFQTIGTRDIKIYANYAEYFPRLADLFAQSQTGDEIFLIGWAFQLEVVLKDKKTALVFLEAAKGRGATVRLLSTKAHSSFGLPTQVSNAVDKNIEALIDDQLPPGDVLNHQKAVLIKFKSRDTHLFLGGMDIVGGRVDAMFDVQAEIIGAGANLGRKTLEERWESLRPPLGGISATTRSLGGSDKDEKHRVQFIRTYPPFPTNLTGWRRTYAPAGDHTYYALICRALEKVENTLYIEDQFFWTMGAAPTRTNPIGGSSPKARSDVPDVPDTLDRLLKNAISRGVKTVVIGDHIADSASWKPHRDALTRNLSHPTNPPTLLQRRPDLWSIHSKVWIFDDEFVVIGSGNFWWASYVSVIAPAEAEFGVAFTSTVDGKSLGFPKASFGRALRIKLWENIRRSDDPTYVFPRNETASFDDEVRELKSAVNFAFPFQPM